MNRSRSERGFGAARGPNETKRTPAEQAARKVELEAELGEEMTLDGLTREYRIFQRRRGHRHSTDDLLTAWYAATHAPTVVGRMLDLGAGIGSIGLSLLWHFEQASLTAVEVQRVSFRLLRENVWANGVEERVTTVLGDLRGAVPPGEWNLVTGSPPYFDVRSGLVSADAQRAAARFELHGDVRDYCNAARRALAPGGRFVFCFPTAQRARAEAACDGAELRIATSRDVVPKEGLPALFSLFACGLPGEWGGAPVMDPPFVVRDREGRHTSEMTAARALFGMG